MKKNETPIIQNEDLNNEGECRRSYFCKMGLNCKYIHKKREKKFFEYYGVDGKKEINRKEWKINLCKIHKYVNMNKEEEMI